MDTHATARQRSYTQTNTLAHTHTHTHTRSHTPRVRSCNTRYVGACKRFYLGSPGHEPCSDDPPRTARRAASRTPLRHLILAFTFRCSPVSVALTRQRVHLATRPARDQRVYAISAIIIMMIEKRTRARDRWAVARPPIVRTSAQASACYGGTAHAYIWGCGERTRRARVQQRSRDPTSIVCVEREQHVVRT